MNKWTSLLRSMLAGRICGYILKHSDGVGDLVERAEYFADCRRIEIADGSVE